MNYKDTTRCAANRQSFNQLFSCIIFKLVRVEHPTQGSRNAHRDLVMSLSCYISYTLIIYIKCAMKILLNIFILLELTLKTRVVQS